MSCTINKIEVPACYELPNMIEVRANLLWKNNQLERLEKLRKRVYENGGLLNYHSFGNGNGGRFKLT